MDSKLLIYPIVLFSVLFHQLSAREIDDYVISKFDFYLSIKSSADGRQTKEWKNAVCSSYPKTDEDKAPCRTEINEEDNVLLYLVKNQSSPVVHGPVVIDPKRIDLDIKYDPSNVKLSDYPYPSYFTSQKEFEPCAIAFARCVLSKAVYRILLFMPKFPVLHTHLQLEPKTADLFPNIEKNDYFLLTIINKNSGGLVKGTNMLLVGTHIISNYTISSKDIDEKN
uniref:Uncharacterized protein n=1 Tax=Tetranychus urticae TaxID=32264 RepID=T1K9A5_TETUR